jgi:two-component system chemotaxis response regulator CheB
MAGHDVIVIGASAGGVEALSQLVAQFPSDLAASIFIVLHTAPDSPGLLAQILDNRGPLRATIPADGEPIEPGVIYVAPPDRHLLVKPGHMHLTRGPRENRSRPAIDVLFRSAAIAYGPRVVGVILTGLLNDGVVGLLAVQRCGGVTVAQDPADATYPDMPHNALKVVAADYVLPLAEMGAVLARLAGEPAPAAAPAPLDIVAEARFAERGVEMSDGEVQLGQATSLSCPECNGPLQRLENDAVHRYRCHVGHAYTAESLAADQGGRLNGLCGARCA